MWQRVTSNTPCTICGEPDWCRVDENGFPICNRFMSPFPTKDNGGGWVHYTNRIRVATPKKQYNYTLEHNWKTEQETHDAYMELFSVSSLSDTHKKILEKRGIVSTTWQRKYRSWKEPTKNMEFPPECLGVPGFYQGLEQPVQCNVATGLLIPYRSKRGLITGIQIRIDHVLSKSKYIWLGSHKWPQGTRATARIHWTLGDSGHNPYALYITEGALKADSIDENFCAYAVAMPGISMVNKLCQEMKYWGAIPQRAIVALDQDGNPNTDAAKVQLITGLKQMGVKHIHVLQWEGDYKGVDDAIVGKAKFSLLETQN